MASKFEIGDFVWAKMKGFPAWPGKVIEPKPEVKRPAQKKPQQFVFFFGSENYAWILEDQMWDYGTNKNRFVLTHRVPRGFKEAIEATEDAVKAAPAKPQREEKPLKTEPVRRVLSPKDSIQATRGRAGLKRPSSSPQSHSVHAKKPKFLIKITESPSKGHSTSVAAADEVKPVDMPDSSPAVGEQAPQRSVIPTPMKIGFLGLGIMGQGMVSNLVRAGHEVTVWNRTNLKCREFISQGCLKAHSPSEVTASCDITFSCVSDPTALRDLVYGNSGVLQGIGPGRAYVDMSTVDVDTVRDISESVTARGGKFLEAPVCGTRQPAQDGQLIILAAGDESLFDDCYSCFEAMGKKSFFLGEVGNAARMKLVHEMLMGTVMAGLAESIALAESVGLDLNMVQHLFEISVLSCALIKSKGSAILSSDLDANLPLQHQQKDLRLAIDMGDMVDQPLHVASAANELFKKAKAKGYAENDVAAVYRAAAL